MILNYYGILPDYWDVSKRPLPGKNYMVPYRGVISWFSSNAMAHAKPYFTWLLQQFQNGKKVVILGYIGGTQERESDPQLKVLMDKVLSHLGLSYGGNFTLNQGHIRFKTLKNTHLNFERRYPLFPPVYEKYTPISSDVDTWVEITRKDHPNAKSSVVITGNAGAFAMEGYIFWEDPVTFRKKWYLNPFLFFKTALELNDMPYPDPTTLNGLRIAFSHIDGDAFSGFTKIDQKKICAEIIKEEILEKYDFPITASVIVGEIAPHALGKPEYVELAKQIFRLPNIEPASHSYSHPFYWNPKDTSQQHIYSKHYGIPIPDYTFSPKMEIDYSFQYITKMLSAPQKPCRVILWTGNCLPTEADIARCDGMGYLNLNGGDTVLDDYNNSHTSVAPLYRKVGNHYQFHCGQANENILTNLWKGPHYGYRRIITTMQRTESPRRLKPIDIYYHFYSGEYPSSLSALKKVYDYALSQDTARLFVSEYIPIVRDYLDVRISKGCAGQFIIENYGNCLTTRFEDEDRIPDLLRSKNVLGYTKCPQGLYISLHPKCQNAEIFFLPTKKVQRIPFIHKANGIVSDFHFDKAGLFMHYKGFSTGRIEILGLSKNANYDIEGTAITHQDTMTSSETGGLIVTNVKTGSLKITPHK